MVIQIAALLVSYGTVAGVALLGLFSYKGPNYVKA